MDPSPMMRHLPAQIKQQWLEGRKLLSRYARTAFGSAGEKLRTGMDKEQSAGEATMSRGVLGFASPLRYF